jgi:hypothetical protein
MIWPFYNRSLSSADIERKDGVSFVHSDERT